MLTLMWVAVYIMEMRCLELQWLLQQKLVSSVLVRQHQCPDIYPILIFDQDSDISLLVSLFSLSQAEVLS